MRFSEIGGLITRGLMMGFGERGGLVKGVWVM